MTLSFVIIVMCHDYLFSIHNIQSLLQGIEPLTLKVVDFSSNYFLIISYFFNSCRLRFEHTGEGLLAILHGDGVTAFCVGRDVDVEAYDAACMDGFLVDDFAGFICNVYQIVIVERVKMNA